MMIMKKVLGYSVRRVGLRWWGIVSFLAMFFVSSVACSSTADLTPSGVTTPRPAEKQLALIEEWGTPDDFFLLLDQSDSMNGWDSVPPTDPQNLRIDASRYFINNLAQRSETEPYLRIGLIRFGTQSQMESVT